MPIELPLVQGIFEASLHMFLERERQELLEGVNERSNCARWALYIERSAELQGLSGYFADAEYNRKQNGQIKTILNEEHVTIPINCDLIFHSRGENVAQDNLIAIELKKHDRPLREKQKDRARLRALTKVSYDGIWVADGVTPPEHVCGYMLGAYVEIDRVQELCTVEYFIQGEHSDAQSLRF